MTSTWNRLRSLLSPAHRASRPGGRRAPRRWSPHRFAADRRGAVAALAAVVFPVVVGGLGLGIETGYWYMTERKLQHAADVAVHAAGARLRAGDSESDIRTAALAVATVSGFLPASGTFTLNTPPASGAYEGDPDGVEVLVSETRTRWFTSLFLDGSVTIRARAVARIEGGSAACMLALSPSASGAVDVSGSTTVTLDGCDVASNSVSDTSFLMSGSGAALTTGCAHAVGQSSVTSGLSLTTCPEVNENAPKTRDPYRDVAEPAVTGNCNGRNVGTPTGETTLTPTESHPSGVPSMRFCNGVNVKGKVTFEPGLYIIEGGSFTVNGGNADSTSLAEVIGHGVTFYLAGSAELRLSGNVALDLSAPTSGPYSGILFFGARDATGVSHVINGTSGSTLQGAVYTPASPVDYKGNSATSGGCTQIVASEVTLTGNSTLSSDCDGAGTEDLLANEGVSIVE